MIKKTFLRSCPEHFLAKAKICKGSKRKTFFGEISCLAKCSPAWQALHASCTQRAVCRTWHFKWIGTNTQIQIRMMWHVILNNSKWIFATYLQSFGANMVLSYSHQASTVQYEIYYGIRRWRWWWFPSK